MHTRRIRGHIVTGVILGAACLPILVHEWACQASGALRLQTSCRAIDKLACYATSLYLFLYGLYRVSVCPRAGDMQWRGWRHPSTQYGTCRGVMGSFSLGERAVIIHHSIYSDGPTRATFGLSALQLPSYERWLRDELGYVQAPYADLYDTLGSEQSYLPRILRAL